ncbi:helix-turn-helix domain-containing protein [Candidatus Bipolaricaulota bacterium]
MDAVGQHIRELRQGRDWTLKELADRCELSTSFISQVERGLCSISIASLHTICLALNVRLADFFAQVDTPVGSSLSRATEVMKEQDQPSIIVSDSAIKYRFLSRDFPGREFEILIGEISPGYVYPPAPHKGEEFGYVLEGRFRLAIGEAEHLLGPGDSYHINATTPHGYAAEGNDPAKVLWVGTVQYFQLRDGLPAGANSDAENHQQREASEGEPE